MNTYRITLQLSLPFYSRILVPYNPGNFFNLEYENILFNLIIRDGNLKENNMSAEVRWTQRFEQEHILSDTVDALVEKGIGFLNHIIYQARSFSHEAQKIVLVSPKTVKLVQLVIRGEKEEEKLSVTGPLRYDPPPYFLELFASLNEPEAQEPFEEFIRDNVSLLELNLLVDASQAIFESRFNEAIIHCATAIESFIFPQLRDWLKGRLFHQREKTAEDLLIEMPTSAKLELFFGDVEKQLLRNHEPLLEQLKSLNKMRNKIIHHGGRIRKKEAIDCLNIASKFLFVLIFSMEDDDEN
jgi:hypothetical protein